MFEPQMYVFLHEELLYINENKNPREIQQENSTIKKNVRCKSLIIREMWIKTVT